MHLAYLSTDELNRELVRGWASRQGLDVTCPSRVDRRRRSRIDAVLLTWTTCPPMAWPNCSIGWPQCADSVWRPAHGYGTAHIDLGGRPLAVHERLRPGRSATSPAPHARQHRSTSWRSRSS